MHSIFQWSQNYPRTLPVSSFTLYTRYDIFLKYTFDHLPLQACPVLIFLLLLYLLGFWIFFLLIYVSMPVFFLSHTNKFNFIFKILFIYLISHLQIFPPSSPQSTPPHIHSAKHLDLFPVFSVWLHSAYFSSIISFFSFIMYGLHLYLDTKHIHIKTFQDGPLDYFSLRILVFLWCILHVWRSWY